MQDSSNLSFSIKLPYQQRCDLPDCKRATQRVYRVNQDNHNLSFCSNDHARIGISRWEEKKRLGVRPGVPQVKEDIPEMVGENISEIEGGE